jgi:hypothetical protein
VARFSFFIRSSAQPTRPWLGKLIAYSMPLVWTFGWFLMSAPYAGPSTDRKIDPGAPVSEWHILAPYHSLTDCQKKQQTLKDPTGASSSDEHTIICVSSNDPRIHLGGTLLEAGEGTQR